MNTENWKHFRKGFKGIHVSDHGRILGPRGIIKGEVDHNGYRRVTVAKKRIMAHRLIAMAWVPNPERKPFVNHKDCDKLNNHPSNLEWVTQKENIAHSWAMGRQKPCRGERRPNAMITEAMAREIAETLVPGQYGYGAVINMARKHGVTASAVQGVIRGDTWAWLTGRKCA